ncbi:uncharacterized protein FFB20_04157 [Fusarium fujikuroi]|uniref:Uncharacterized protein n=1 Tax=Fusarium fujikuroi TaxID=5127 RepID=A0A2H3RNM9_FUSFU|nr:uncharacterized protein Y057_943 [Fusarium fujikuroi]QGI63816.1 hypothetical protein CEK27_007787 [Fusarium fujikuroi]QGI81089.1 hypothetical protein CEK25_007818 [Fusarium fujikuroi]QGI94698.1 hypothetical protein CEK26_007767 [Fusarium fujikuroi]SCN72289.1 uncharacterized protein FFB20_04157 [Fusarium fujikuroi]
MAEAFGAVGLITLLEEVGRRQQALPPLINQWTRQERFQNPLRRETIRKLLKEYDKSLRQLGSLNPSINSLLQEFERKRLSAIKSYAVPGLVKDVPVLAFPDTGSSLNTISESFATVHGLSITRTKERSFRLPNGQQSRTIGIVEANFRFQGEQDQHTCVFHVLPQCPEDVILGKGFLNATNTLSTHAKRIQERVRPCLISGSRVFFLADSEDESHDGPIQELIPCTVNGQDALSLPDTGSDLMLLSRDFAHAHGFYVYTELRRLVQLADGSSAWTDGMVLDAELGFDIPPTVEMQEPCLEYDLVDYIFRAEDLARALTRLKRSTEKRQQLTLLYDLHVMENLPFDVILSSQFVFDHKVFSTFRDLFITDQEHSQKQRSAVERSKSAIYRVKIREDSLRAKLRSIFGRPARQVRQEPTYGRDIWEQTIEDEEVKRNRNEREIQKLPQALRKEELKREKQRQAHWDAGHTPSQRQESQS